MENETYYLLGLILSFALGIVNAIPNIRRAKDEKKKLEAEKNKIEAERLRVFTERDKLEADQKEIEDRITQAVLKRAEAQLSAYQKENEELRNDNETLRRDNADTLRMVKAIRMLTVKLVNKMEKAGIDPELTQEEREALYDTGKLKDFAKRQAK